MTKTRYFLVILPLLTLAGICPIFAQVEWLDSEPSFLITSTVDSFPFEVKFKNISTEKITINEIKASCGCTLAKNENTLIMPEAVDIVKATYKPGTRVGANFVTLYLTGESLSATGVVTPFKSSIRIKFNIEQPIIIRPTILVWKKDGAPGILPSEVQQEA
jgi:hypothetical protein